MSDDVGAFDGGPPWRLEHRLGLIRDDDLRLRLRMVVVAVSTWAPLALLIVIQEVAYGGGVLRSFIADLAVHTRFLIAAPLLILAESIWRQRSISALQHFVTAGIVRNGDRRRYQDLVRSRIALLRSIWAELAALVAAYAIVFVLWTGLTPADLPFWQGIQPAAGGAHLAAVLWHLLVSLPILLVFILGWFWRQFVWFTLLRRVARLDLKLVPSHPDRAGGLMFLSAVIAGCKVPAFALSAIAAGSLSNHLREGEPLSSIALPVAVVLALILIIFVLPYFAFSPLLLRTRGRAIREYGALGLAVGGAFEAKWLRRPAEPNSLQVQDFSATADLYQVVSGVHRMTLFPADMVILKQLAITALLPFAPLLLFVIPIDVMIQQLAKLLM